MHEGIIIFLASNVFHNLGEFKLLMLSVAHCLNGCPQVMSMKSVIGFSRFYHKKVYMFPLAYRWLSDSSGGNYGGSRKVEHQGCADKRERMDVHSIFQEKLLFDSSHKNPLTGMESDQKTEFFEEISSHQGYSKRYKREVDIIYEVLQQDGPGNDAKTVLDGMHIKVNNRIMLEVLMMILRSINHVNKARSARLAFKFFMWANAQGDFRHTSNSYNIMLKIFAVCEEFKPMWRLLKVMIEEGVSTTARTFNILICTCGQADMARKVVEQFMMSETFNFRPFKHSFNAILHSLLVVDQYRLIEWVYQQMLHSGHSPDILTYNILMYAKYRLGKLNEFSRVFHEMGQTGISPNLHTYNILLHVLGKSDKPVSAIGLLDHMDKVGCHPRTLHFTSLIDGLSRAGNLDACKYFFDKMLEKGCEPDVVFYTVMITGYVVAGDLDKAQKMFDEMMIRGKLPNVFTYNSMIRGLCVAGKFEEARNMLQDMKMQGCHLNFLVYSRLVPNCWVF